MSTTTAAHPAHSVASPWGPGAQRRRALSLLVAGFVATNAVAALCAAGFGLARGQRGLGSALVAAAVVVLCFGIAQGVQVLVANASPTTVLMAAMGSYLVPFVGLGVLMWFAMPHVDSGRLDAASLVGTLIACVLAWTTGMIAVFRRLRFPVYDHEYTAPNTPGVAE